MASYSVERLFHFLCGSCGERWSVGDHQGPSTGGSMTCPRCGEHQDVFNAAEPAPTGSRDKKMIRYSVETLHHFSCGPCKKWWTSATWAPSGSGMDSLFCPHCGVVQAVEELGTPPPPEEDEAP